MIECSGSDAVVPHERNHCRTPQLVAINLTGADLAPPLAIFGFDQYRAGLRA
jgi:hypothetical protein